jgi:predicted nucleotidyltransferase
VQGVLLYGSVARSDAGLRSDIDLCIVAPQAADKAAIWREFISHVIEEGLVVYARDVLELYEYFYPFRREWEDQKHRQEVSLEEMRGLIQASRKLRACGRC